MGRKKKNMSGKIISVRVNGDELESLRKIMLATQKSASNVMRSDQAAYRTGILNQHSPTACREPETS